MKYEDFTKKAIEKHGNKYKYPYFDETSVDSKIKIICPTHGEFEQAIYAHLRGQGCPKCIGEKRGYTTENFISDAKKKFGNKFDYSKTEYKNRRTKVCIMCDKLKNENNPNGEFFQYPLIHLNSSTGLPFMGKRGRKYSKETDSRIIAEKTKIFIEKAKNIHGEKIDFSKTIYTGCQQKSTFICPIHGDFKSLPSNILKGHGCPKCGNRTSMTKEEFVEKAREVHGDKYDYSKVDNIKSSNKICIICPTHGEFWQNALKHLKGCGCSLCSKNKKDTKESFIDKARKVHGNKYDYSKIEYINAKTKVCIICPKHGEFWQRPVSHLKGNCCPYCKESHLEEEISLFLDKNNIQYEKQKKFGNIKYKRCLPFDFYLPKYNVIIECQGEQHFEETNFFNDEKRFLKDKIKYDGCIKNNIKILYYTSLKNYKKYFNKLTYTKNNLFHTKESLFLEIKKG